MVSDPTFYLQIKHCTTIPNFPPMYACIHFCTIPVLSFPTDGHGPMGGHLTLDRQWCWIKNMEARSENIRMNITALHKWGGAHQTSNQLPKPNL